MASLTPEQVRGRLAAMANALEADGYRLDIDDVSSGLISARIVATHDACPDCLVPKDMMTSMMRTALSDGGIVDLEVELRYPSDA